MSFNPSGRPVIAEVDGHPDRGGHRRGTPRGAAGTDTPGGRGPSAAVPCTRSRRAASRPVSTVITPVTRRRHYLGAVVVTQHGRRLTATSPRRRGRPAAHPSNDQEVARPGSWTCSPVALVGFTGRGAACVERRLHPAGHARGSDPSGASSVPVAEAVEVRAPQDGDRRGGRRRKSRGDGGARSARRRRRKGRRR